MPRKPNRRSVKDGRMVATGEKPALATPLELAQRIDRAERVGWVYKAVAQAQPTNARGQRQGVWVLAYPTLVEAAILYCVDKLTVDDLRERFEDLAKPHKRSIESWCKRVHDAYAGFEQRHLSQALDDADLLAARGDLLTVHSLVMSDVAVMIRQATRDIPWSDMTPGQQASFMRLVEGLNQATVVQWRSKESKAKTQKIEAELRKAIGEATDKGRKKLDVTGLAVVMGKLMGVEPEDDAGETGVAA